jgi:hypothetical protein
VYGLCPKACFEIERLGSYKFQHYDRIVHALDSILKYSLSWIVREEYGTFRDGYPDDNHRPDIIIRNPTGTTTSLR